MSNTQLPTTVRRILLPVNRASYRFLKAINKIRMYFNENTVSCIPCVENPFEMLLSTKKLSHHNIRIIEIANRNSKYGTGKRLAIQFHGSLQTQKKMLADYLRTQIIEEKNAVLLPRSISNFIFSNQINNYIYPKYKSLEEQKQLQFNFYE